MTIHANGLPGLHIAGRDSIKPRNLYIFRIFIPERLRRRIVFVAGPPFVLIAVASAVRTNGFMRGRGTDMALDIAGCSSTSRRFCTRACFLAGLISASGSFSGRARGFRLLFSSARHYAIQRGQFASIVFFDKCLACVAHFISRVCQLGAVIGLDFQSLSGVDNGINFRKLDRFLYRTEFGHRAACKRSLMLDEGSILSRKGCAA